MSMALEAFQSAASAATGLGLPSLVMSYVLEQTRGRARKLHVEITASSAHIAGRVSSYLLQRIATQAARDAIHALMDLVANPRFRPTIIETKFAVDDAAESSWRHQLVGRTR